MYGNIYNILKTFRIQPKVVPNKIQGLNLGKPDKKN